MKHALEIAVVVALVLVAPCLIGCGGDAEPEATPPPPGPSRSSLRSAAIKRAEVQMATFATAVELYYMRNRKLPDSLEVLAEADPRTGEPWIVEIPNDPWGNPYDYKALDGKEFYIRSRGEDGHRETDADLLWPPLER